MKAWSKGAFHIELFCFTSMNMIKLGSEMGGSEKWGRENVVTFLRYEESDFPCTFFKFYLKKKWLFRLMKKNGYKPDLISWSFSPIFLSFFFYLV